MVFFVVDKFRVKDFQNLFRSEKVKTDNLVFRLHYKLSVLLVVLYSVSYSFTLWQEPISCIGSMGGKLKEILPMVSDFCLIAGTYTLSDKDFGNQAFAGIGTVTRDDNVVYQHSYKWMYIFIFCSTLLLLTPRTVWRHIEAGRMERLVGSLKDFLWTGPDDERLETETNKLEHYLTHHFGYHNQYAYWFVFCEFLNVVVVFFLMFLWDMSSGNAFSRHGANFHAFTTDPYKRTDPLSRAYPVLSKCRLNKHGYGGNLEIHDFICVMPLNAVNERAAIFFWHYFMALGVLGIGALVVRIYVIFSKRIRLFLLCGVTSLMSLENAEVLNDKCSYGDWFVIYQLAHSLDPVVCRNVLERLIIKIKNEG